MKIVVALSLALLACQSDPARPSAHADTGGKQVDSTGGVQLILGVSSVPYRASVRALLVLPPLEAHLKNVGSDTVTFVGNAIIMGNIEIDGIWHNVSYGGSCCMAPEHLPPNATSPSLPVLISRGTVLGPAGPLDIPPGRHTIRLRTLQNEFMSIDHPGRRGIVVVSNAVDIDVR